MRSQKPRGLILTGGLDSNYSRISSVGVVGFENCLVPDLPEARFDHGSFMTENDSLAVCGGWWDGKPWSSDCLVLNTTSKQWQRGLLGNILGNAVLGVVSLDVGTFMVHPRTSSFLPDGAQNWTAGPTPSDEVQCAAGISASSFLIFGGKSVRQYDSSKAGPSMGDEGWLPGGEWDDLRVERRRPGCATIGALCLVAGGRNHNDELLKSVEVIFLTSKSLGKAEDMMQPRDNFQLIALGTSLLALGGHNEKSIEMWEGEGESWKEAPMGLANPRSRFSALTSSIEVCSDGPLPPHSCPTMGGGTCVFPFEHGLSSNLLQICYTDIFPRI